MDEKKPLSVEAAEYMKRIVLGQVSCAMDKFIASVDPDATTLSVTYEIKFPNYQEKHTSSWNAKE